MRLGLLLAACGAGTAASCAMAAGGERDLGAETTTGAPTTTTTPATTPPTTPGPTPEEAGLEGRQQVRNLVSFVEACHTDTDDYRRCRRPAPHSLGRNTGLKIVQRSPRPGEVRVTARHRDAYKAIATDAVGTRWIISKARSSQLTRTCRLASGDACTPRTW